MKTKPIAIGLGILLVLAVGLAIGLSGGVTVTGEIPLNATDGPTVIFEVDDESQPPLEEPVPDANTVNITTPDRVANFSSDGPTELTLPEDQMAADSIALTNIDVSAHNLTIDAEFEDPVTIAGDVDSFTLNEIGFDDGEADFSYSASGAIDVRITNLPATDSRVMVVDAESGDLLDDAEADANGDVWFTDLPDGEHDVSIELAPEFLEVRDELTNELIEEANATVEFFFESGDDPDLIVSREVTDGTVDMIDLPIEENFVVEADADGYVNRRIFVPSLFETQTIYLLDDQTDAVAPEFFLKDFSGEFPGDRSVLEIKRNIDDTWQTVEGDFFGSGDRFTATLHQDRRHRLVITNTASGQTRNLGTFTPTIADRIDIEIFPDDEIIHSEVGPSIVWHPETARLPATDGIDIDTRVRPGSLGFESYTVTVELNETVVSTEVGDDPDGETFTTTLDLTDRVGESVVVTVDYELEDGSGGSAEASWTVREHFDNPAALLPTLESIRDSMGGDASNFSMMVTLIALVLGVGYAARVSSSEVAGLVGLVVLAFFWSLSFIPTGWVFIGFVMFLTLMGVQRL